MCTACIKQEHEAYRATSERRVPFVAAERRPVARNERWRVMPGSLACERAPGDSPVHSAVYRSELLAGLRCLPPSMLKALFRHSDERHASMLRMQHAGAFARSAGISTIELLQQQSATFHGDSIFKILWIAWLYSDSNCLETPALAQS